MKQRSGSADDAGAAAELLAACMPEAWSAPSIAEAMAAPGGRLVLLEESGRTVGAILLRAEAESAEVLQVAVEPGRRREGLGRRLLRAGEAVAIAAGARRCFLEVRATNAAARRLYQEAGYEQVGLRAGYYRDGEDALVLARPLEPGPLPPAC